MSAPLPVPSTEDDVVTRTELIVPGPAEALAGLLDVPLPDLAAEGLPLLWHWLYLLERPRQEDLGPDGHPVRGTIPAPPAPGRRRMWAGGEVRRLRALRVGEPATRRTCVESVREKDGRTGRLTFVAVRHRVHQAGELAVDERQDLVYLDRRAPQDAGGTAPPEVVPPAAGERSIEVTPTLLFRFSALTYNGHRIHYDRDYARTEEGYPGLVTHGPLQAVAMAEAARAAGLPTGPLTFGYRLLAPLHEDQGLVVRAVRDGARLVTGVRDVYGRQTASGTLHAQE